MEQPLTIPALSREDLVDLRLARALLESESLAARVAEVVGQPIEKGLAMLPPKAHVRLQEATRRALQRALSAALSTIPPEAREPSADRFHRLAAATSGAPGGFFGLGGLAVELPVTTVLMLRSIADIARSEGHDLALPETQVACLEVFALGGPSREGDPSETAYYAVRAALAGALADAAGHIARRGLASEGAPALVRAVSAIAARFGVIVEEKVALGAIPVVGALTASLVNAAFTSHFQRRARRSSAVIGRAWSRIDVRPVTDAGRAPASGAGPRVPGGAAQAAAPPSDVRDDSHRNVRRVSMARMLPPPGNRRV
jgi:hypothetical protein